MNDNPAETARTLASEAMTMLDQSRRDAASALAAVARVYAGLACTQPVHRPPVTFPNSRGVIVPAVRDERRAPAEHRTAAGHDAPTEHRGLDDPGALDEHGVPVLLLSAHRAVEHAGGRMYVADLARHLALDPHELGVELNALLRRVGITRPGAGTLPVPGGNSRPGYLAHTLAAAIDAHRSLVPAGPPGH
ncbi:hypothetical protein [Kitasatospora sp. McL0602]|uniref:hypothetical protein n=1 Tax=Kitasatospora sp. McL0602 TaxID=3439530 RepID=UPI003F8A8C7B